MIEVPQWLASAFVGVMSTGFVSTLGFLFAIHTRLTRVEEQVKGLPCKERKLTPCEEKPFKRH